MKFILLSAAAMIAMPAVAQMSGSTGTSSPTQAAPAPMPAPAPDATTPPPPPPAAPMAPMAPQTGDNTPVGGYQPAGPALSGPVTPGATVVFTPAPSPDQAYPAPAPLAKYPICKKGQYDQCMQRGGR